MEFLIELWLPIVLSAVLVFAVSSILHMVIGHHNKDFTSVPDEDALLDAIRAQNLPRGEYYFPFSSMKEMGSPEMLEKYQRGPVGQITMLPNAAPAMGTGLVLWFLYTVLVGVFIAYVARIGLPNGAPYLTVFRVTGSAAMLAYALAYATDSIWKGKPWSTTAKFMFDGVVYALVTAGTFSWLWPDA